MFGRKLLFLFLLLPFCSFGQDTGKVALEAVLKDISGKHNVKFSYIDEELAVYAIVPPDNKLPLKEKLDYIEKRTRLKFEAVNSYYYTVFNDVRMDKPLCGYLIDAQTKLGIDNATIEISGLAVTAASGANGYFRLPVLAPNTIVIKHIGYKTITISPQDLYVPECPVITMEPVTVELEEIVTHRYLATGISRSQPGKLVVRPRSFGILPGLTEADVLQTMQLLPGVSSVDDNVSNINVRGGTHDQNLFLWNGIRMYQTSHFFGLLSAFNPLPATNISIYKNGSPAFYGEGVSSLVNISSKIAPAEKSFTTIAADMLSLSFLSMIRMSDKAALQVSGRRSYADVLATPTYSQYEKRAFQNTVITDVANDREIAVTSREDFYFYDASLQYQHKLSEQHELFINGISVENDIDVFQDTGNTSKNSGLNQRNFGGSISLTSKWGGSHETETEAYVSWYDLNSTNRAIESEKVTRQRNTVLDIGFRSKYTYTGFKDLKIAAGYQLGETGVTNFDGINIPVFSRKSREVSLTHAVIGEGSFTPADGNIKITAGLRANYFDKLKLFLAEPRLALLYSVSEKINIEISGEQKSQTVSQVIDLQQDFLGLEKRRWVLANNDIPVQKSSQASAAVIYNYGGWLASAEGFYKKIDGITSDSQAFQNQFEFTAATGRYTVLGAEMLLQKSFSRFYTWISYSYNDNQYHFSEFVPPGFTNNFSISHAVAIAATYEWNNLKIALGSKWRTGKPFTAPQGFTIDTDNPSASAVIYNAPNSSRLDDFFLVNFSASKTWNLKNGSTITAGCSVLNVLNRNNIINRFYRINRGNNSVEEVNTYGLGRTPNVSLKFTI